jgi:hypothetical protein
LGEFEGVGFFLPSDLGLIHFALVFEFLEVCVVNLFTVVVMLNLGRDKEAVVIVLARLLGFDGEFLFDPFAHAVGFVGAPLDHARVCGIGGTVFGDNLEYYLIMHVSPFGIA